MEHSTRSSKNTKNMVLKPIDLVKFLVLIGAKQIDPKG